MATPVYQGQGQPAADGGSGWLGQLGSFFGASTTPAYAPAPVPAPVTIGTAAAAAMKAAAGSDATADPSSSCPAAASAEELSPPRIAIVIPRGALYPDE